MRIHFAKFFGATLISLSVFALVTAVTTTVAFGQDDPVVADAANVASQFNDAASSTGISSSVDCAQDTIPDAPIPHQGGVASLIHEQYSVGVSANPGNMAETAPRGTVGITIGKVDIAQALAKSELIIPPGSKLILNFKYNSSPMILGTVDSAVKGVIQQLNQYEGGTSWEEADIQQAESVGKAIKKDALTQEVSVSMAISGKNGDVYSCKVGKAPEVNIPASDPNGTSNRQEVKTGATAPAARVGSSYSTLLVNCVDAVPLGQKSKIQFSFLVYRGGLPYVDENSYFANLLSMTKSVYEKNKDLGLPNSVRGGVNYTKVFSNKNDIAINATVGESEGKITSSVNVAGTVGKVFAYGGLAEAPHPDLNTGKPDPQKGEYGGVVFDVGRRISLFGTYEKDVNQPDSSESVNANGNGNVDEEIGRVGAQWEKKYGDAKAGDQGRLIVGGAIEHTVGLDNSLSKKDEGLSYNFFVKDSFTGHIGVPHPFGLFGSKKDKDLAQAQRDLAAAQSGDDAPTH
jgi:hypothetical protein